jgi:small subunit ribosomal protein SAe
MASKQLPSIFDATAKDIEMLLAASCHVGAKNIQVHMEPYLWKTRPDGINIINIGKTWYGYVNFCAKEHFSLTI